MAAPVYAWVCEGAGSPGRGPGCFFAISSTDFSRDLLSRGACCPMQLTAELYSVAGRLHGVDLA